MSQTKIINLLIKDFRFPGIAILDGSDVMNPILDDLTTYKIIKTVCPNDIECHRSTFAIGRGNELCVVAIESLSYFVKEEALESFAVIVNMVWDLHTKVKGKLLWRLIGSIWPKDCLIVQMHSECSN